MHAFNNGQHPSSGIGAGVPSGQSFNSLVQGTPVQLTFFLHAVNDGQHPSTGIGAGVPSGQIFKSIVQKTVRHLDLFAIKLKLQFLRHYTSDN